MAAAETPEAPDRALLLAALHATMSPSTDSSSLLLLLPSPPPGCPSPLSSSPPFAALRRRMSIFIPASAAASGSIVSHALMRTVRSGAPSDQPERRGATVAVVASQNLIRMSARVSCALPAYHTADQAQDSVVETSRSVSLRVDVHSLLPPVRVVCGSIVRKGGICRVIHR